MALEQIKSDKNVIERIKLSIGTNSISHAYLFEGNASIDKRAIAVEFVKAILCEERTYDCCDQCISCNKINHGNHEDVFYLSANGNSIKDEAVEEMQNKIKNKPFSGERNIVILENADTMTVRAQNRLLKTLEEPPKGTVLILLAENIESLLSTILSRCIIYKLNGDGYYCKSDLVEKTIQTADLLLEKKPFYEITKKLSDFMENRELAYEWLDVLERWYRDLVIYDYVYDARILFYYDLENQIRTQSRCFSKKIILQAITEIEEARNDLNRNLNVVYTIKNMILRIIAY